MKALTSTLCLVFLTACLFQASAQEKDVPLNTPNYSKRKMFTNLPEKSRLRLSDAEELLNLPVGAKVNATIAAGFPLIGTIVSKSNPADTTVKSVVVRTANQGSVFTFSRVKAADGKISFIGRMLNKEGGDALEIVKEDEGYVLRKKNAHELLIE